MLDLILQQIINGLMVGSIYVLISLGMVLIYGVMNVLNFSHGVLFTLAAYIAHTVYFRLTHDYISAVLAAIVVVVLIGAVIERVVFRPLRGNMRNQVVAALGLVLVFQNAIILIWGALGLEFRIPTSSVLVPVGSTTFTLQQLIIIAVCAAVIGAMYAFLTFTNFGIAMRATSQNPEGALVVGIQVNRMYTASFAIGTALAALGGSLLAPVFLVFPQLGDQPLVKGLAAIVLGGLGSVWGAVWGALFIGIVESLSTLVIPSDYRDVITFLAIIAVILVKPSGLFGTRVRGEA